MKLSLTQENLSHGLNMVTPIAQKGGTLPILQNILLEATDGTLRLKSTNLEIGVTAHIRGKIEKEGVFTVNGRLLNDYISLLKTDKIDINLEGEHLHLSCQGQKTKIHGLGAEEFPLIPEIDESSEYTVLAKEAREALGQTLFAVSINDARPEISGVLLKFQKDDLIVVATDSYRLAEKKIKLKTPIKEEMSVIVPLRAIQELSRILSSSEGDLNIKASSSQILFSVDDIELISRLIVGNFPDYEQIVPKKSKSKVSIDKEPLARAVKSAALFCRQGLNHVNLQFSKDRILVSSSTSQVGENTVEVAANIDGEDIDIVFDYRYILDGLAAIDGSEVTISFNEPSSPGVFSGKDEKYLYLVMPIKQ